MVKFACLWNGFLNIVLQCNITKTAFRFIVPNFRLIEEKLKFLKIKKNGFPDSSTLSYIKIICMWYIKSLCGDGC